MPVKALYEKRGLCAVIPATGGVDDVFSHTQQALSALVPGKPPRSGPAGLGSRGLEVPTADEVSPLVWQH